MARTWTAALIGIACALAPSHGVPRAEPLQALDQHYSELEQLYTELHRAPELSLREERTAARLAAWLERLGFDVTPGVGGHGLVGVLRNGQGPTLLLRTDMDGLPVVEKTGLPYASTATTIEDQGVEVGLMHACGHDVHMTAWVGAATLLAESRGDWRGTLLMVAQPAEERGLGAKAMLDDGLFLRFPKPDFALALHTSASLPAGQVGYTSGHALASVDSVDITIHGQGGHGAYPHTTIDPIVIASRTVVALQTIVAREIDPLDPAVVTVGSMHAGSKHNIIPDEARLQLTVRSYRPEVRERLLAAIARIARGEAQAAGALREPDVEISEGTPSTYNDPELTARVVAALRRELGDAAVVELPPVMAGEDFSRYGRAGVPAMLFWVGGVSAEAWAAARSGGEALPSLHSPRFAPDREPTLRTAVRAATAAALELLGSSD